MDQLGKYKIVSELGRGGMGTVYKGRDTVIGRDVAIKVIQERAIENEGMRKRFYREARSAGRLSHENITIIHDVGEEDGMPFLVMEYLEGEDLRTLLNQGTSLSNAAKLSISVQICRGLHYAHQQGIIHRDIKPANIRVLPNGRVKVMDFGIARFQDETQGLTQTNMSLGTPRYMAPEQVKGEKVDGRVDIFSFGALLYELFEGVNPFEADHFTAIMYKVLNSEPRPLTLPPQPLREHVQAIVTKCLAKDPEERYQDFGQVARDVQVIKLERDETVEWTAAPELENATQELTLTRPVPAASARDETVASVASSRARPSKKSIWMALGVLLVGVVLAGTYVAFSLSSEEMGSKPAEEAGVEAEHPGLATATPGTIVPDDSVVPGDSAEGLANQDITGLPAASADTDADSNLPAAPPRTRETTPALQQDRAPEMQPQAAIEPEQDRRPATTQPGPAESSPSRLATEQPPTIIGIRPSGAADDEAEAATPADAQVIAQVEETVTMLTRDLKRFIEEENTQWMEAMLYRGWDAFFQGAQDIGATVQPSNLQVSSTQRATVNVDVQLRYRDDYGEWKAEIRPYTWRLDFRNNDWMLTRVTAR